MLWETIRETYKDFMYQDFFILRVVYGRFWYRLKFEYNYYINQDAEKVKFNLMEIWRSEIWEYYFRFAILEPKEFTSLNSKFNFTDYDASKRIYYRYLDILVSKIR